jgi:hypothetical protein
VRLQLSQLQQMWHVGLCVCGGSSNSPAFRVRTHLQVHTDNIHPCFCLAPNPTQDGGGVTKDGALPPAPTLFVSGERELVSELERIIDSLNKGVAVDWEKR